ncbi:MAG: peptidylprolyl isomerase [Pseudomonadota bacterium]
MKRTRKRSAGRLAAPDHGHRLTAVTVFLSLLVLLAAAPASAQTLLDRARADMSDPGNPLLRISTARGEFHVELYPEAAPESVEWFRSLMPHYAGLTFDHIVPGVLIRSSGPGMQELPSSLASAAPAPEINAGQLGLEQQPLMDDTGRVHDWMNLAGRQQFEEEVLVPLYRELDIRDRQSLEERSDEVAARLRDSSLAEAYRRQGYVYDEDMATRPPRAGSVLLLAATPERSSARIAVTLTDTPWLRGRHTVIGQVVGSQSVVRVLGSEPRRGSPPAVIYRIEDSSEEDNGS